MINHYINLVCWRQMLVLYDSRRDLVWIDSVSLRQSIRRLRRNAEYRPATRVLTALGPGSSTGGNWFFFTAAPVENLPKDIQMPLPIFKTISVPDDIAAMLRSLPANTRVGIGISAPKQNYLAAAMHALRPDLEYHCFGAAIADFATPDTAKGRSHGLSGTGFEWMSFLVKSPSRTLRKIVTTLREAVQIRFHGPSREDFERFAAICMPAADKLSYQ